MPSASNYRLAKVPERKKWAQQFPLLLLGLLSDLMVGVRTCTKTKLQGT
jgi:hypothetical protein